MPESETNAIFPPSQSKQRQSLSATHRIYDLQLLAQLREEGGASPVANVGHALQLKSHVGAGYLRSQMMTHREECRRGHVNKGFAKYFNYYYYFPRVLQSLDAVSDPRED